MRLEPEGPPDTLHSRHRQAAGLRDAAGTPMDGVLRATLQCPHDHGFDAASSTVRGARSAARRAARPRAGSTKRRRLPSARQGPAWPPLPCSDRLPRRSARSALAAPGTSAVFRRVVSDFSSARTSSLNVREASCRTSITFSVPATSSILAQRRKSNANLRLQTCGSGHWPRRLLNQR